MADDIHRRGVWVLAAAALAAALALGYLGTRDPSPAPAAIVEKLSLALPTSAAASLLHVASARGYFAEEALDVTIVPTTSGKEAIGLVVHGKADLAAVAEVPFVILVMKGEALVIAASVLSDSSDNAVVARRDRGISAPRDLLGKNVGVTFGTSGEYYLWALLIRHKLPPGSVTLVDLPPTEITQALAKGAIDATATWHPIVPGARAALGDNAVTFAEPSAYTQTFVVVGRGAFLKDHPKVAEKLVRALLKAEEFMQSRPEDALNLTARWLEIDVETLRSVWKNFNFRVDLLQSQLITMEDEARWAMARGYVAKGPVPNFLPNLYLDALLAVRPERVTVVR